MYDSFIEGCRADTNLPINLFKPHHAEFAVLFENLLEGRGSPDAVASVGLFDFGCTSKEAGRKCMGLLFIEGRNIHLFAL
jgi:hypothetical protein